MLEPRDWSNVAEAIPHRPMLDVEINPADFVTVVTGLPRSGTSLMMQMLDQGGLAALTDGKREPDEDNPKGYFEFDKSKNLRKDKSWMREARGKSVKIIAQLLQFLPDDDYRIIYMERDLNEVIRSQRAMLDRAGKSGAKLSDEQLKDVFAKQIQALGKMLSSREVPILKVAYRDCIESPNAVSVEINRFLGGVLDESAMARAVDAKLYRQRT